MEEVSSMRLERIEREIVVVNRNTYFENLYKQINYMQ